MESIRPKHRLSILIKSPNRPLHPLSASAVHFHSYPLFPLCLCRYCLSSLTAISVYPSLSCTVGHNCPGPDLFPPRIHYISLTCPYLHPPIQSTQPSGQIFTDCLPLLFALTQPLCHSEPEVIISKMILLCGLKGGWSRGHKYTYACLEPRIGSNMSSCYMK